MRVGRLEARRGLVKSRPVYRPAWAHAAAVNRVQPGSFLTLHYRLAGPDGADVVNTFDDQPATLSLGTGELAPAMEARLLGLAEGARATLRAGAGEAFGERNPEMLQRVSAHAARRDWATPTSGYDVGDVVQFPTPDGQAGYAGVVREVGDDCAAVRLQPPAGRPAGDASKCKLIGVL